MANPIVRNVTLAVSMTLLAQACALAQGPQRERRDMQEQGRQEQGRREQGRQGSQGNDHARPAPRGYSQNGPGNSDRAPGHQRDDGYRGDRGRGPGAGPDHNYYRGSRLPPQYRSSEYVVDDWRAHRLSPPPRGYHWVQTGGDYVLVAIATGIILQFLLGH